MSDIAIRMEHVYKKFRKGEVDRITITHEGRLFAPRFWVAVSPRSPQSRIVSD